MTSWRVTGASFVTLGAVMVIGGSAMPWLRTGQRRRSSYELFGIVDRLGFSPSGAVGMAIRLWPFVPLLAVAAAITVWFAPRWSLVPAIVVAIYAGGVGLAVSNVDTVQTVGAESGPSVTWIGAAFIVAGSAVATHGARRRRLSRSSTDPDRPAPA